LIESDLIAKAIIDLIPILQIRKLVIGANKSQIRYSTIFLKQLIYPKRIDDLVFVTFWLDRKLRSRKGSGIVDQIVQNAPESCNVSIVCDGKEVNEQIGGAIASDTSMSQKNKHQQNASVSCVCFNF